MSSWPLISLGRTVTLSLPPVTPLEENNPITKQAHYHANNELTFQQPNNYPGGGEEKPLPTVNLIGTCNLVVQTAARITWSPGSLQVWNQACKSCELGQIKKGASKGPEMWLSSRTLAWHMEGLGFCFWYPVPPTLSKNCQYGLQCKHAQLAKGLRGYANWNAYSTEICTMMVMHFLTSLTLISSKSELRDWGVGGSPPVHLQIL